MREKQEQGVEVTIITWQPDDYGFGDTAFWMQLHEDMRQAGFFVKSVEDSCENFAVIDQEIVWYGNIHLLGKEKIEDSIMRVKDKKLLLNGWNLRLSNKKRCPHSLGEDHNLDKIYPYGYNMGIPL